MVILIEEDKLFLMDPLWTNETCPKGVFWESKVGLQSEMSKKKVFYLTKDFFYFCGFLFKIIDLVGVAARSRPKKCSFIEKNWFEVQLPSFDIGMLICNNGYF
jgi:hypothetical protein